MNIKELRIHLNLTQEAMARELGISLTTLRNWEYGSHEPSPMARDRLERLIERAGINLACNSKE